MLNDSDHEPTGKEWWLLLLSSTPLPPSTHMHTHSHIYIAKASKLNTTFWYKCVSEIIIDVYNMIKL